MNHNAGSGLVSPVSDMSHYAIRPSVMLGPAGSGRARRSAAERRRARPLAASGPTPSWVTVARHERSCESDGSKRAGGKEAAARATTSQAKTCSANSPTSYHHPHASCPAAAKGDMQ